MTTKEYLNQYSKLNVQINKEIERLARLENFLFKKELKNVNLQNHTIKIITLKKEINCKIDNLYKLKESIKCKINKISDEVQRKILILKYINSYSFKEIAVILNLSYKWTCILHGKALQKITL